MRLLATLVLLALGTPAWSAKCGAGDTAAVKEKLRAYLYSSPESPQRHRMAWTQGNSDHERILAEYNGLKVSIDCQTVSKADLLNGIQIRGEISFDYDAARFMSFPDMTPTGVEWHEWSEWVDEHDTWNASVLFRKLNGQIQLQREFVGASYSDPIPVVQVDEFFAAAEAESARWRQKEAEQQRLEAERAEQAKREKELWQSLADRMTKQPDPAGYFPHSFFSEDAYGTVETRVCVDPAGRVDARIARSSGVGKLDRAALAFWRAHRFRAVSDPRSAQATCVVRSMNFAPPD
jgi:TonB family protein